MPPLSSLTPTSLLTLGLILSTTPLTNTQSPRLRPAIHWISQQSCSQPPDTHVADCGGANTITVQTCLDRCACACSSNMTCPNYGQGICDAAYMVNACNAFGGCRCFMPEGDGETSLGGAMATMTAGMRMGRQDGGKTMILVTGAPTVCSVNVTNGSERRGFGELMTTVWLCLGVLVFGLVLG